jgi:hypothetical protein
MVCENKGGVTMASSPKERSVRLTALWGDLMRYIGFATLIVGVVTAAMDKSFGGFTPIYWFLIAIFCFIIVVCTEVVQLRMFFQSKKEK